MRRTRDIFHIFLYIKNVVRDKSPYVARKNNDKKEGKLYTGFICWDDPFYEFNETRSPEDDVSRERTLFIIPSAADFVHEAESCRTRNMAHTPHDMCSRNLDKIELSEIIVRGRHRFRSEKNARFHTVVFNFMRPETGILSTFFYI